MIYFQKPVSSSFQQWTAPPSRHPRWTAFRQLYQWQRQLPEPRCPRPLRKPRYQQFYLFLRYALLWLESILSGENEPPITSISSDNKWWIPNVIRNICFFYYLCENKINLGFPEGFNPTIWVTEILFIGSWYHIWVLTGNQVLCSLPIMHYFSISFKKKRFYHPNGLNGV